MRLREGERVAIASALASVFGEALPGALALLGARKAPALLGRAEALDCCAELLEAADRAAARGECVASFALLGIESRLLEELVGAGAAVGLDETEGPPMSTTPESKGAPVEMTEQEWRQRLTPDQFHVLRGKGTDRPFTGEYTHPVYEGTFRCAGCGAELFAAGDQFDSGSGWPSFVRPIDPEAVELTADHTLGMRRIEVTCRRCGGHLGHVFDDGPGPDGERWCINSTSLELDGKPATDPS